MLDDGNADDTDNADDADDADTGLGRLRTR